MKRAAGIFIAVFCGVILAAGIVLCFFVQDQSMILSVVALGVLYVIYMVNLVGKLQKQKKSGQTSKVSPLTNRRK